MAQLVRPFQVPRPRLDTAEIRQLARDGEAIPDAAVERERLLEARTGMLVVTAM